jgi:hypothetical protein
MGLDIIYSYGAQEFKFRATSNEFEALATFAGKNCKEAFGVVFGRPDFDNQVHIKTPILTAALKKLIEVIKEQPNTLMYSYDIKVEIPRGSGNYAGGGQAICGLKIDGDFYDLEHGYDKCVMMKKWQTPDGKIHMGEPQDVRHLTIIRTDADSFFGDVKIIKRKAGGAVLKKLAELERFLAACSGKEVSIALG